MSRPRRSSHRLNSPPASSPKLPRLFPSTSKEQEEAQDDEEEEEEAIAPRRITRHAYQEEVKLTESDTLYFIHEVGCSNMYMKRYIRTSR